MLTLVAFALFGVVGLVLAERARLRPRGLAAFAVAAALVCAGYQLLSQVSPRTRADVPLRFESANGAPVRVHDDHVQLARAHPRGLLAVAVALAAVALLARRWRPRASATPPARATPSASFRARVGAALGRLRVEHFVLAVLLAPYALTFAGALLSPYRGYDALWYHLPAAVAFARARHLEPPGRDLVFYFPANLELLARAMYDAFGARALALVQWPFALAAAACARSLAQAIGVRPAWLAAALVLATPIVLHQSDMAYADVLSLFAVTATAWLTVTAARAPVLGHALLRALLAGLALGLLAGAKYAALPLGAALLLPLALSALAPTGKLVLAHARRAAFVLAALLAGTLVPSLFWYARNLRLTGNPIFPIHVAAFGWPGLFTSTQFNPGKELEQVGARWQWLVYLWSERVSHESGLGAAFVCVAPLALVLLGIALLRQLRRGRWPAWALPFAWGASYLAVWWFATPHEPRHLLPLVTLLGVPALALVRTLPRARTAVVAAALFSSLMVTRTLLFSETELGMQSRGWASVFDLPAELTRHIPDGAKIQNLAGRPYNFALLGPQLTWRLHDYAPAWPTPADLAYNQIDFVVYRGPAAGAKTDASWSLLGLTRPANLFWWEQKPSDVIALYRINRP